MALRGYVPETASVYLPDGNSFAVRGLSLEDISILLRTHYAPIKMLFDKYAGQSALLGVAQAATEEPVGLGSLEAVALEMIQVAPGLLADAIALAADEPGEAATVRKLPASNQVDAAEKIILLTLKAEGGLEKLVETVSRLTASVTDLAVSRSP